MNRAARHGFTLIELIVVVVIISIIAAVVTPRLLKGLGDDTDPGTRVTTPTPAQTALPRVDPVETRGVAPVFEEADIRVALSAREERIGMNVFARFRADYRGHFVVRAPRDTTEPVRILVPLPEGTTEAEGLSIELQGAGYEGAPEPEDVELTRHGIVWVGLVPRPDATAGDDRLTFNISFTAKGRDRFVLRLPPARALRQVRATVTLDGVPLLPSPEGALEPKRADGDILYWEYSNLLSDRPIIVALPGVESPLGRVTRLFKLVGIAVLLFGVGFWYLSELYKPGCLDSFRWGHFLLLALTYSLFFVAYAVLGFRGVEPMTSLAVAGVLSMPLLGMHVWTIMGGRFAATYTLPLAALTIGLVVNGVYGGDYRSYVFVGAAFVIIAGLTLTYQDLSAKRDLRRQSQERELAQVVAELHASTGTVREAEGEALAALAQPDAPENASLRELVEQRRKELADHLDECELLGSRLSAMESLLIGLERRYARRAIDDSARALKHGLPTSAAALRAAVQRLGDRRKQRLAPSAENGSVHCIACGYGWEGSPYCPHCGTKKPVPFECGHCGEVFLLPVHLLDEAAPPRPLHCGVCGHRHRSEVPGYAVEPD